MKKKQVVLFLILCFALFLTKQDSYAATLIKSGTVREVGEWGDSISFRMNSPGVLYFKFELSIYSPYSIRETSNGEDGVKFMLTGYDNDEEEFFEDFFDMTIPEGGKKEEWWYWPDTVLPAGDYMMDLSSLSDDCVLNCKYSITYYNNFASSFTVPETVNVKTDGNTTFKISNIYPSGALHGATWTSLNPKIADIWYDGSNTVHVYGMKAGTCKLKAILENGKTYYCTVKVTNPAPKLNYKNIELYTNETSTIKLLYTTKKVKWKSSNNKVATVSSTGKIKAKKIGSCFISTKLAGKTYKAKVKVIRQSPNFTAYLTGYNTRDNYFTVQINNKSNKSLTIYSAKAYSMDVDYKYYDRKLKLTSGRKSITIKPHKKATIKFKIIGSNTWPDYSDHTIRFYFSFDGKKYLGSVWDEDSSYKDGKKWYTTYWV